MAMIRGNIHRISDDLEPHEKLIAAVIAQGIKDRDYAYMAGETFEFHCSLVRLDPDRLRSWIKRIIIGD